MKEKFKLAIQNRKQELGLSIENLAKLSNLNKITVSLFLENDNNFLSVNHLQKIAECLGLDLAGNESISISELRQKRAREKATYIVSLVQGTSILEMQGLNNMFIDSLIYQTEKQFLYGEYQDRLWVL